MAVARTGCADAEEHRIEHERQRADGEQRADDERDDHGRSSPRTAASSRASSSDVASTDDGSGRCGRGQTPLSPRSIGASTIDDAPRRRASTATPGANQASRLKPDFVGAISARSPYVADERVDDFLRAVAALDERDDVAMHRRRHLAGKVGRATGVDVERAAALTVDAVLEVVALLGRQQRGRAGLGGSRTGRAAL